MPGLAPLATGILAIVATTALSCAPGDSVSTTAADSAAVAIVTNVGTPTLLPWALDTVRVFGGDDSGPATFHEVRQALVDVDAQGRIFVLAPRIWWSQWGDHVAVSAWAGFRVDVLESHGLLRSIRWAGVGEDRLSRSEAVAYLEAQGYLGPCDDDVGEMIEKHGYHPQPQIVRGLAVAPDGRLWVQVNTIEGARILLLDTEGYMVGVLPEGFPMPLTFLPDGRPLVQVVDSLDVQRIGVVMVRR